MMRERPSQVRRLQKCDASIQMSEMDRRFGETLQALCATKTGGLSLVLGPKNGLNLSWLMAGLPNDSRLLAVSTPADDLSLIKTALDTDLRVAFHSQDPQLFLKDIESHHFDLIYCDLELTDSSYALIKNMLLPGAVLICNAQSKTGLVDPTKDEARLLEFPLQGIENVAFSIYVKGERALKRRGGRQANADRRSLRTLENFTES